MFLSQHTSILDYSGETHPIELDWILSGNLNYLLTKEPYSAKINSNTI